MKLLVRLLGSVLAALAIAIPVAQAKTIVIGHVDLPYHEVTAAVYKTVLERSGYSVALKKGPRGVLLSMLAEGELDLFVAPWLPHLDGERWAAHKEKLVQISPLYDTARFFWAVPDYIPESAVNSIADLTKPEVVAKMNKAILGPQEEPELASRSEKLVQEYALSQAGYEYKSGTTQDWVGTMDAHIKSKSWFVMPLWQPHYLNTVTKLRMLQDPKHALGQPDTAWLAGNKQTEQKIESHIFAILERMEFSTDWIAELDRMVHVEQYPPHVAARIWMAAHPYTIEYWINAE